MKRPLNVAHVIFSLLLFYLALFYSKGKPKTKKDYICNNLRQTIAIVADCFLALYFLEALYCVYINWYVLCYCNEFPIDTKSCKNTQGDRHVLLICGAAE